MEKTNATSWEQQSQQSLLKRMIAAAMREYCRGPEADREWVRLRDNLEMVFDNQEVAGFSFRKDEHDGFHSIELKTLHRGATPEENSYRTLFFTLPIQVSWIQRAQAAQDEGLLSVLAQVQQQRSLSP